ncbi:MAG: hypothetical protein QOJ91_2768 [Sphingomonadales bacterium]|jgi:uncharacterized membrane protein YdjX (TVP38/TMEM64 family)|nr:hypothetical protein [Sphingomonadales bacterium]
MIGLALLAILSLPFILFEGQVLELGSELFGPNGRAGPLLALAILALFAGDVLLPVPSSLVSVAAVALFGWAGGGLLIWVGTSAGCALGYWLGRRAAHPLALRYLGSSELEKAHRLAAGIGPVTLVLTRAVPVLAEASTVAAGLGAMPFRRFALVTSLGNAGIALVYAAGAAAGSGSAGSVLLPFGAAVALPVLGWLALRLVRPV